MTVITFCVFCHRMTPHDVQFDVKEERYLICTVCHAEISSEPSDEEEP